ncbi:MAG TPA: efflux RND transporter periplasmic adaptor subunit [Steroidobacteraceae bacterium]|nr:efflux RND transporter periplasmic adaptor subunit [Steroidobacteraceae bacterium]
MRLAQGLFIVIAALAAAGCKSAAKESAIELTPVRIATAVEGPGAPAIRTNGLLANKDEIRMAFKVGGVIRSINVSEGEHVRKGQTLADIEQTEINAQVEQAREAQEKAQRDVQRGERLYGDKVISLEQLQDLRTQLAVATAALKSAQFNRSYAAIVAPRDGVVLRKLAEARELVSAGSPVIVLGAQDQGFVVRAGVSDREIVQIKIGDRAQIRLDALPDQVIQAKVTEVGSAADPATGMFVIEAALDAAGVPLKSGLVAKVSITPSTALASKRVYVPVSSVVEGDGSRASVYVLERDHVRRHEVEVAFIENESIALNSGVKAGDQVVTDGSLYLEDGEKVAIADDTRVSNTSIAQR